MLARTPDKLMTKEESYVERRKLFKNIWETAMRIDDEDILTKPKVIKTLRMDELDKIPIGKTKRQRIKNLRHVCNRILDFCDRQDADDKFYEQMSHPNMIPKSPETVKVQQRILVRGKLRKIKHLKRRVKKPKALFETKTAVGRVDVVDKSVLVGNVGGGPSNKSYSQDKQQERSLTTSLVKKPVKRKSTKNRIRKISIDLTTGDNVETATKRRGSKKKHSMKRKKYKTTDNRKSARIIAV